MCILLWRPTLRRESSPSTANGATEAQLADPEVYADHARSGELLKRFEECRGRGESLVEEMAELEAKLDEVRARHGAGAEKDA